VTEVRRRRVAYNEEVSRRANDRLREDWRRLGMAEEEEGLFLCECGDVTCKDPLRVRLLDYEAVRAQAGIYVVIPGHEDTEIEGVVEDVLPSTNGFNVVRKHEAMP